MKRLFPSVAAVLLALLTAVGGVISGQTNQRWGPSAATVQAADALEQFPREFSGWSVRSNRELTEVERRLLSCNAYFSRTYVNSSGTAVHVAVLLGPPGPLSVHQPEICYSSRDYHVHEPRHPVSISRQLSAPDQFWRITFARKNLDADLLHVYYAWATDSQWQAPSSPRWQYGGEEHLFQIQVAAYAETEAGAADAPDACREFLDGFLPRWRKTIGFNSET